MLDSAMPERNGHMGQRMTTSDHERKTSSEQPRIETTVMPGAPRPKHTKRSRKGREIAQMVVVALLLVLLVRLVVLSYRVVGSSMTPNLHAGQALLVNPNAYRNFDTWMLVDWLPWVDHKDPNIVHLFSPPQRGDVVILKRPDDSGTTPLVKRIIGLEGETVELLEDGVYIDGQRLDEPYLNTNSMCIGQPNCGPFDVPIGHVFVLGDNRSQSYDSPDFGSVLIDSIIGKAWLSYWPLDEIGILPQFEYPEVGSDDG